MVGITKDDGALPSRGLGGASEKSGLLVVLGYIGAQTWLPIGRRGSRYVSRGRSGAVGLNPLLFSYLVVLGTTACAASFARWRDEWSRGVFGAFAGALAAIAGAALLLVPERGASVAVAVLRVVSGALLGLGGGLLTMVWSERFGRLDAPARSRVSFLVVLAACLLAAFAQSIGIHWLLLAVVAVFSAVSSALFMVSASRGEAPAKTSSPVTHLQGAFVRIIASYGLFGLVFALMITQFLIARHGHALSWTWLLSLSGVVISLVVEVGGKGAAQTGIQLAAPSALCGHTDTCGFLPLRCRKRVLPALCHGGLGGGSVGVPFLGGGSRGGGGRADSRTFCYRVGCGSGRACPGRGFGVEFGAYDGEPRSPGPRERDGHRGHGACCYRVGCGVDARKFGTGLQEGRNCRRGQRGGVC